MYETINADSQTQQEVKAGVTVSPQQQEFQYGSRGERSRDDYSYVEMSSANENVRITRAGFTYPPFAANQNPSTTTAGNPHFQQPCPHCSVVAGSSFIPALGHITVTGRGPVSPTMVVMRVGAGEILKDDDQEYTVMSQAGTLTSQNSSMTAAQQGQSTNGASGNVALPMYSIVNKGEPSKPHKVMVTEC